MKRIWLVLVAAMLIFSGCAHGDRYNTQRGALLGAGLGALSGQAIGHNTEGTLIGTGAGALLGAIVGNAMDQEYQEEKEYRDVYPGREQYREREQYRGRGNYRDREPRYDASCDPEPPPGRWVVVPGQWEGRRWVPAHKEWRPIQPM
jgi:hypothetical protein